MNYYLETNAIIALSTRLNNEGVHLLLHSHETLYRILLKRPRIMHISGKVFPMDIHDVRYAFDETVKRVAKEYLLYFLYVELASALNLLHPLIMGMVKCPRIV